MILGFLVALDLSRTQFAAFKRRSAPLIDMKFKKKYENISTAGTLQEIVIGIKSDKQDDNMNPFAASDLDL